MDIVSSQLLSDCRVIVAFAFLRGLRQDHCLQRMLCACCRSVSSARTEAPWAQAGIDHLGGYREGSRKRREKRQQEQLETTVVFQARFPQRRQHNLVVMHVDSCVRIPALLTTSSGKLLSFSVLI